MNNGLIYYSGRMRYQKPLFDVQPIQPEFNQKLFQLGIKLKKIDPKEFFKDSLSSLHYEDGVIIGQAITIDTQLKPQLIEKGFNESTFARWLHYLIEEDYLQHYGNDSADQVSITTKGFRWLEGSHQLPTANTHEFFDLELTSRLPADLAEVCKEFNFVFVNSKKIASLLLLRRILPLSIVRKFQKLNREPELKDRDEEYFGTQTLIEKIKPLLKEKRPINELTKTYKFILDLTQHSFSYTTSLSEVEAAAIRIKAILCDMFS
jgi:hypothetical protein